VTYGTAKEATLDWKIRQVTKDIFKDPLDVVGQNIENIIDECLIRDISPVVSNIYCNPNELIIEDFIGMTPEDVENNYVTFGVSGKSRVFGRYGHGGKDTALNVAGFFHLMSKIGTSVCAYKIWEEKDTLKVRYSPAWGLDYPKEKDGTLIIVPNRQRFTIDEIKDYLLRHFYLGLIEERIIIGIGQDFGSRTGLLKATIPDDCETKPIQIQFNREEIEKYCRKPPLKQLPEVKGFYLIPKDGTLSTGYNLFSHGKFITCITSSTKGIGYLEIDFLPETSELTGSKELKIGKNSFYAKYLVPRLIEWESSNLAKSREVETDLEFIQEVEMLLGPLFGGSKKQTKIKRKPKQIKQPIEFKRQPPPDSGKTPGHGKLNLISESRQPLVVGIQLPDSIFINKGNADGKYIWELDRKTKKTLLYSRAAIFLPFVQKSKSGSLTSTELSRIHAEALKSQEFWMNAIRRDQGEKQEIRYLGNKRFTVQK
jgi:hypothetical protein